MLHLISPAKGLKTRAGALARLRKVSVPDEKEGTIRGTIIANEDGTFTPCVFLTGRATIYARPFVEAGLYVVA